MQGDQGRKQARRVNTLHSSVSRRLVGLAAYRYTAPTTQQALNANGQSQKLCINRHACCIIDEGLNLVYSLVAGLPRSTDCCDTTQTERSCGVQEDSTSKTTNVKCKRTFTSGIFQQTCMLFNKRGTERGLQHCSWAARVNRLL